MLTTGCLQDESEADEELADASAPPLRVGEDERDVGLRVAHVGEEEGEPHHQLAVQGHAAEVGVGEGFGH